MTAEVRIVADAESLARAGASAFVEVAKQAVRANGVFTVALSGGSTPKALYSLLASDASFKSQVPWDKTHFFWGDERHVPPDHADSNYRMTNDTMLANAPVPAGNVHRIKGELEDARQAAEDYERALRDFFKLAPGQLPRFDLVLLGMGPDGHTASLFPGTKALSEQQHLVVANWVEKFDSYRITLTLPVLNNAACVVFLVSGAEKADTLCAVLSGEAGAEPYPSQLIHPTRGRLIWLVSSEAARQLPKQRSGAAQ
jgi:6-phosphogluconolactonase